MVAFGGGDGDTEVAGVLRYERDGEREEETEDATASMTAASAAESVCVNPPGATVSNTRRGTRVSAGA
jgi:hypothetical protein